MITSQLSITTGNYRIDMILSIASSVLRCPVTFQNVQYLSGDYLSDQWSLKPWSRSWWNSFVGLLRVNYVEGSSMFGKLRDDPWLKTAWAIKKFRKIEAS